MSKKLDPNPVEIEGGAVCRKCGKPMQRYEHFQHYEAAKVICS